MERIQGKCDARRRIGESKRREEEKATEEIEEESRIEDRIR